MHNAIITYSDNYRHVCLQEAGILALDCLAYEHQENRVVIFKAGGLRAILAALERHCCHVHVQKVRVSLSLSLSLSFSFSLSLLLLLSLSLSL
jgi:hypothetical protein